MIDRNVAAALAFTAFGANLLGAVLLLLLNSGSRSVRWYMPFQFAIVLWLFSQGADMMWQSTTWEAANIFCVTLMPLLFLMFAWMEDSDRPNWQGIVPIVSAAPLLMIAMRGLYGGASTFEEIVAYIVMFGGWLGGSVILWLRGRRQARTGSRDLRRKVVVLAFLLIAPLCVVASIIMDGPAFVIYGMPVVTIMVQLLIFYAITQLQFYNIEVRVRRTGDIAAESVQTARLAVLGELAATIAHEVRNPLTGVRSLAQRIAADEVPADKRQKYGEVILEETSRVERLVSNLLELSRKAPATSTSTSATTSLAVLFEDLALLVGASAERARVQVVTQANDVTVNAAREGLAQVLLNLLLNAVQHSPQNSVVSMTAERAGSGVKIRIRDHGEGVPPAERERIFDPFFTTNGEGTGLGLSVVRHVVRENGWKIEVADAPGGGALFEVTI